MTILKKNYRKVIFSILLIIGIYYVFSLPPILICRGGIESGKPAESINNSIDQSHTSYLLNDFLKRKYHKVCSFDYFYFLNFKFWQDLNIKQSDIIKSNTQEAVPEKLNPFLYRINQNLSDHAFNFFDVTRENDKWYYSYYVQGG